MVEFKAFNTEQIQHIKGIYTIREEADEVMNNINFVKNNNVEELKGFLIFTIKYEDTSKFIVQNTIFNKTILN